MYMGRQVLLIVLVGVVAMLNNASAWTPVVRGQAVGGGGRSPAPWSNARCQPRLSAPQFVCG